MINLFSKKSEARAAPKAKQPPKDVTVAELKEAIAMVSASMEICSARRTMESLYELTNGMANGDFVKLEGPAPVTLKAFDEALAGCGHVPALGGSALSALKRVRALVLAQEKVASRGDVQYVTVQQLKAHDAALFDAFSWALGAMLSELNLANPTQTHILAVLRSSATTPERKKVFSGIADRREIEAPRRTQEEWLRYQNTGRWS
jgi:hypothetical protein